MRFGTRPSKFRLLSELVSGKASVRSEQEQVSTMVAELKACSNSRDVEHGKSIHAVATAFSDKFNMYIASSLINMYMKCGRVHEAQNIFYSLQQPDVVCWNGLISGYAENGLGEFALEHFKLMQLADCPPTARTFVAALKACTNNSLAESLHAKSIECGFGFDMYLANSLIYTFCRCRSVAKARLLFDTMPLRDLVTWNVLLQGYVENEEGKEALYLFTRMQAEGCKPDSWTFVAVLKACCERSLESVAVNLVALERGFCIHSQAVESGCVGNIYLECGLINMYASNGSLFHARTVFDQMRNHDIVSWNSMLAGCVENHEEGLALDLIPCMKPHGFVPDSSTYVAAFNSCAKLAALEDANGMQSLQTAVALHNDAARDQCDLDPYVRRALINMYGKCGSLVDARRQVDIQDLSSCTSLMLAYIENGAPGLALDLFTMLRYDEHYTVDEPRTFVAAVKACTSLAAKELGRKLNGSVVKLESLEKGMDIHALAEKNLHCCLGPFVENSLVDMYVKAGSLWDARRALDRMQFHTVVSWNALLMGYGENGEGELALHVFECIPCSPDSVTYVAALKACAESAKLMIPSPLTKEDDTRNRRLEFVENCMKIHSRAGREVGTLVGNTLVDTYSKCGSMLDARAVFDTMPFRTLVSWNALVKGYVDNEEDEMALSLFSLLHIQGHVPDAQSYAQALKACGAIAALESIKAIHSEICQCGLEEHEDMLIASLVDVYGKCGNMEFAKHVFDSWCVQYGDCTVWTSLIAGYSRAGDAAKVFETLHEMHTQGFQADSVTFLCVLSACSHAGLVEKCKEYMKKMRERDHMDMGIGHVTCLVDALGRLNSLEDAVEVAKSVACVASVWRALLGACLKWRNTEVGRIAYDNLIKLDAKDASAYVLMANICESQ